MREIFAARERQVKVGTFPPDRHDILPFEVCDATLLDPEAIIHELLDGAGFEGFKAACLAPFGKAIAGLWHIDIRAETEGFEIALLPRRSDGGPESHGRPENPETDLGRRQIGSQREAIGAGTHNGNRYSILCMRVARLRPPGRHELEQFPKTEPDFGHHVHGPDPGIVPGTDQVFHAGAITCSTRASQACPGAYIGPVRRRNARIRCMVKPSRTQTFFRRGGLCLFDKSGKAMCSRSRHSSRAAPGHPSRDVRRHLVEEARFKVDRCPTGAIPDKLDLKNTEIAEAVAQAPSARQARDRAASTRSRHPRPPVQERKE